MRDSEGCATRATSTTKDAACRSSGPPARGAVRATYGRRYPPYHFFPPFFVPQKLTFIPSASAIAAFAYAEASAEAAFVA